MDAVTLPHPSSSGLAVLPGLMAMPRAIYNKNLRIIARIGAQYLHESHELAVSNANSLPAMALVCQLCNRPERGLSAVSGKTRPK